MRMLIAEKWNECARMILPADCSPLQRREMRRAFYAGAEGLLKVIMDLLPGAQRRLFRQKVRKTRCPANGTKKTAS